MPCCKDCFNYSPLSESEGDCQINGKTEPDRESERCPSRTFRPKAALGATSKKKR
jgi:hypothetical protein